jgi:hypothetical protein
VRRWRLPRRPPPALCALALYVALSIVFFGQPILHAPDEVGVGSGNDPNLFMWMIAWWPHAIGHGIDPLSTGLLFAPDGFNLMWTTSIPGPSLLVAPITLAAGPIVAYNVLALLAPALSAFTAFLLCRHVTVRTWPSLVGGYVFGFSDYMLGALAGGHLHLTLLPLLPLCVLLVLRHIEGSLTPRRFVVLLTVCLVGQFLISPEVLVMLTIFGGLALLVPLVFSEHRRQVLRTVGFMAIAYAAMAVVVSPLLYAMLVRSGTHPQGSPAVYASDLANFVIPTGLTRIGWTDFLPISSRFGGNFTEQGAYFGIPLLLIVGLFAARRHKSSGEWALVVVFATAAVLSLGTELHVSGVAARAWMPWQVLADLPVTRYALPARALAYMTLAGAVIVAWWLARRPSAGKWLLALLGIVAILPNSGFFRYQQTYAGRHWYAPPRFITAGLYKRQLHAGDRVMVIPFGDARGMQWQTQAHLDFALAGGYVQHLPAAYLRWPIVTALLANTLGGDDARRLAAFLAAKRVTVILVDARHSSPWRGLLARMRLVPTLDAGALVYRLRPPIASRGSAG